jgi:hypothetical protein
MLPMEAARIGAGHGADDFCLPSSTFSAVVTARRERHHRCWRHLRMQSGSFGPEASTHAKARRSAAGGKGSAINKRQVGHERPNAGSDRCEP